MGNEIFRHCKLLQVFLLALLFVDQHLPVGRANGRVVEPEIGGTRDRLGRRVLLVEAAIPCRGFIVGSGLTNIKI